MGRFRSLQMLNQAIYLVTRVCHRFYYYFHYIITFRGIY